MQNEYTPLKVSGAKLHFRLQMSNLTRIQPQVSNYSLHRCSADSDNKRVLFKMKTPSHFMLSAMAPHGREMSQDLRKKIIYLHKKGEGYKKISKALLISQNTVAKVVHTFKKDGTATICGSSRTTVSSANLTIEVSQLHFYCQICRRYCGSGPH